MAAQDGQGRNTGPGAKDPLDTGRGLDNPGSPGTPGDPDNPIARIDELITEEHELRSRATGKGLTDEDRTRLREVEQRLDQCWDLLRQRRARAEFGENPSEATVRPASEVESYRQ